MRPLGAPAHGRTDPAPSLTRYRVERLLLSPLVRLILRAVIPFTVVFTGASLWVSVPENRDAALGLLIDARRAVESRPEFQVRLMAVDGASPVLDAEIRAALPLDLPASSLDLDLARMQAILESLPAVRVAHLHIRQGGVLQVDIVERRPVALMRMPEGLLLLDDSGKPVRRAEARAAHPDLPVIAGGGAQDAVPEALALLSAIGPLRDRLRGFERFGERRWDVVLDAGQRILLPEKGAARALDRAVAMAEAEAALASHVTAIDLRLPRRPTLRLTEPAATLLWTRP